MKRVLISLVCVMLILGSFTAVFAAEDEYANAYTLYSKWVKEDSFPDYICGVWSTDGGISNLTFGIQDNEAGNAGKEQIMDMLINDSSVTFVYQQYSINYLHQIADELLEYLKLNLGIVSSGTRYTDNCVNITIHESKMDDPDTQAMVRQLEEKYGSAVRIEFKDVYFITSTTQFPISSFVVQSPSSDTKPLTFLLITIGLSVILMAVMGYTVRRRRLVLLMQTSGGIAAVSAAPLTNKRIEKMVKHSSPPVTSQLDKNVMDAVEKIAK